ncbi:hypothetical protein, partial [Pseudarthrobacter oxydans]|uniref:hypothetical protein n=1 Tax=Pseudarthrobacter oxydans TaxID=1671 RepID=UPI0034428DAA
VLDNHVYDGDGLTIIGLEEAPDTYGHFAANWLERQLKRPVERQQIGNCSRMAEPAISPNADAFTRGEIGTVADHLLRITHRSSH